MSYELKSPKDGFNYNEYLLYGNPKYNYLFGQPMFQRQNWFFVHIVTC
jgi:hypothetical protein